MKLKEVTIGIIFIHFFFWSITLSRAYTFQSGFFFITKKELPILAFISLFYLKEIEAIMKIQSIKRIYRMLKAQMFSLLIAATVISVTMRSLGFIYTEALGFKWSYTAIATYSLSFLIFYKLFKWRSIEETESLLLSGLLCKIVGIIYELPIYFKQTTGVWFHISHPFFIESTLLLIPCLTWYLTQKYSFNKRMVLLGLIPYFIFSAIYTYIPMHTVPIHRIPAILALVSIIIGIKHKNEPFTPTHLV